MSCNITRGRLEGCKDSVGGINSIYFYPYDTINYLFIVNNQIVNCYEDILVFKYELKGNGNNYSESYQSVKENGNSYFNQTLNVVLKGMNFDKTTQFNLLLRNKYRIFVHMNNGECLFMGLDNSVDSSSGSINTGTGLGDLYGYNISFTSMEKTPAMFVLGSTVDDPFAGFQNSIIIDTDGTAYNGQHI